MNLSHTMWQAAQGKKSAQRKISAHYAQQGNMELAAFWSYKANGGAAFSPESLEYKDETK